MSNVPVLSYKVVLRDPNGKVHEHIVLLPASWRFEEGCAVEIQPFVHMSRRVRPAKGETATEPAKVAAKPARGTQEIQRRLLLVTDLSSPPPPELATLRETYVRELAAAGGANCSSCTRNALHGKIRALIAQQIHNEQTSSK